MVNHLHTYIHINIYIIPRRICPFHIYIYIYIYISQVEIYCFEAWIPSLISSFLPSSLLPSLSFLHLGPGNEWGTCVYCPSSLGASSVAYRFPKNPWVCLRFISFCSQYSWRIQSWLEKLFAHLAKSLSKNEKCSMKAGSLTKYT